MPLFVSCLKQTIWRISDFYYSAIRESFYIQLLAVN